HGLGISHLAQAYPHFVHRPVARQQMAVAIIDLAPLRVEHLEFTGIAITLREEDQRLFTGLNADDLRDNSQGCYHKTGHNDRGTEAVLLPHGYRRPPNRIRSANHSSSDWVYSAGSAGARAVASSAASRMAGSGGTKPGTTT